MTQLSAGSEVEAAERPDVPVLDDAAARTVAEELGRQFADGAAERDRDLVLPEQQMDELVRTGLLAVTVPARYGGGDVSPVTITEIFRVLASADPNIAQILHGHFVNVHLLKVAGNPEQQRFFFEQILTGAVFAAVQTDLPHPAPGMAGTRLTRDEPGYFRLNGVKTRANGAVFARWLPTLARLDDGTVEGGEELVAFVPRTSEGVSVVAGSDDLGQRTAASGRVDFVDVQVPSEHIMRRGKALVGTHGVGSYARLLHAAIEVGIAGEVLAQAAQFVRTKALPEHEAHVRRAQDDPLVVQRFGELTVDVRAAEAALGVAAHTVTESLLNPSEAAATQAAVAVATVKVLAERAALAVTGALFEVGGSAAAARALNLDRHWRNARTLSLEDPIRWKYHHLGRFTLLGVSPPRHRQI